MHPSERQFADFLESQGKTWVSQPKTFKLSTNGQKAYRPDFYCFEDDTYYEVKKVLHYKDVKKMLVFKKEYPTLKLRVVSPNGFPYLSPSSGFLLGKMKEDIDRLLSLDILDITIEDYNNHIKNFLSYKSKNSSNRTRRLRFSQERAEFIEMVRNDLK